MSYHDLFNDKSALYAQARPRYPQTVYQFVSALSAKHQRVWDVACGNGQAAIDLATYFEQVEATDVSPQQIANAASHPRISYAVLPAEEPPFPDEYFDAICVAQALHWFDYERFWPQVERVLKPGGVFTAWGYSWFTIDPAIDAALQTGINAIIQPYWPSASRLLWNGYRDVPFPFPRVDAPEIEMTMSWTLDQLFAYVHSWSATRRCMADRGDDFFEQAYQQVSQQWGDGAKPVKMEFHWLVGRKP